MASALLPRHGMNIDHRASAPEPSRPRDNGVSSATRRPGPASFPVSRPGIYARNPALSARGMPVPTSPAASVRSGSAPVAVSGRDKPAAPIATPRLGTAVTEGSRGLAAPAPALSDEPGSAGYHGAVSAFKRRLIEATLTELGGNRTRAARALGLQRTYLLRLMREFAVDVPASGPRRGPGGPR